MAGNRREGERKMSGAMGERERGFFFCIENMSWGFLRNLFYRPKVITFSEEESF